MVAALNAFALPSYTAQSRSSNVFSSAFRTALHANGTGAEVGQQSPRPGSVEVAVTENAPTSGADTTFQQVHAPAALIAVGGDLRASENLELRHCG